MVGIQSVYHSPKKCVRAYQFKYYFAGVPCVSIFGTLIFLTGDGSVSTVLENDWWRNEWWRISGGE